MSPTPVQWMEICFNLSYLVVIYGLVGLMTSRLSSAPDPNGLLQRFRDGFLLLAIGDTGHVGFRAIALLRGGLEWKVEVFGISIPLVGVGALATAITVTFLYLLLLDAWRLRFQAPRSTLFWGLAAVGIVRLLLLIPAANRWGDPLPPWDMSVLRNAPLTVLGLAVAGLFLRDGRRAGDKTFVQFGALILLSFAFYLPVILFVQQVPALGALMVPKTLVYLAMGWLAYARLFRVSGASRDTHPHQGPPLARA